MHGSTLKISSKSKRDSVHQVRRLKLNLMPQNIYHSKPMMIQYIVTLIIKLVCDPRMMVRKWRYTEQEGLSGREWRARWWLVNSWTKHWEKPSIPKTFLTEREQSTLFLHKQSSGWSWMSINTMQVNLRDGSYVQQVGTLGQGKNFGERAKRKVRTF